MKSVLYLMSFLGFKSLSKVIFNESLDCTCRYFLILVKRSRPASLKILDDKGRKLPRNEVQGASKEAKLFSINGGKIKRPPVFLRNMLKHICKISRFFVCLGENMGEWGPGLQAFSALRYLTDLLREVTNFCVCIICLKSELPNQRSRNSANELIDHINIECLIKYRVNLI